MIKELHLIGGKKIRAYSAAPDMWNELFKTFNISARYRAMPVQTRAQLHTLCSVLKKRPFSGANVALPWKTAILDEANWVHRDAKVSGAANTIRVRRGHIEAFNTDGEGMVNAIERQGFRIAGKRAVLVGAGGAAAAILVALLRRKIDRVEILNHREPETIHMIQRVLSELPSMSSRVHLGKFSERNKIIRDGDIIINATTLGMTGPNEGNSVFSLASLKHRKRLVIADAVYNPPLTPLIQLALKTGQRAVPGTEMLKEQALISYCFFFPKTTALESARSNGSRHLPFF